MTSTRLIHCSKLNPEDFDAGTGIIQLLPGRMALLRPTETELAIIAIYAAELQRIKPGVEVSVSDQSKKVRRGNRLPWSARHRWIYDDKIKLYRCLKCQSTRLEMWHIGPPCIDVREARLPDMGIPISEQEKLCKAEAAL